MSIVEHAKTLERCIAKLTIIARNKRQGGGIYEKQTRRDRKYKKIHVTLKHEYHEVCCRLLCLDWIIPALKLLKFTYLEEEDAWSAPESLSIETFDRLFDFCRTSEGCHK
jgi:hypothetical protein